MADEHQRYEAELRRLERDGEREWLDLEHDAFEVEQHGIDLFGALAGATATTVPLAVGLATGHGTEGLLVALGGLNTSLVVPRGGFRRQAEWTALGAVGVTAAVLVAQVVVPSTVLSVAATLIWIAAWGTWRAMGKVGALTGFAAGAVFVIANGLPALGTSAWGATGLVLLGTLGGGGLGLAAAAVRRHGAPGGSGNVPALDRTALAGVGRAARDDRVLRHHLARTALTTAAGVLIYRLADLQFGYWIPLTALAVLQPDAHAGRVKALQRASGTLLGAAVVLATTLATTEPVVMVMLVGVCSFGLFALKDRNYHWLVALLTPTALLMISAVTMTGWTIAVHRLLDTAIGLLLAGAAMTVLWHRRVPPPTAA